MKPKISILIPCYNVEKYLSQCLDSVVNQTLKDIEIIVINDGSTDSTLKIINQYAKKDKRIKVIDKENEGYGKSMNRGLDAATGEYIGIVESDDWVDSDMFENLVKLADKYKVDVVKSNFYEYTTKDGEKNVKAEIMPEQDCERVIKPRHNTDIFWSRPAIWAAIYKRDFLKKYNIRFLESPGASYQDTGFNFKVWMMADRAFLTSRAFLHYRCDNENSSVKSSGKVFCVCDEWDEIDSFLDKYPKYKKGAAELVPLVKLRTYLWNLDRLTDDAQQQFRKRFQSDYLKYINNGTFDKSRFSDKDYYRILITIFPNSVKYKLLKAFYNIIRPIYKTKFDGVYKRYYLFGIKIMIKHLPALRIEND